MSNANATIDRPQVGEINGLVNGLSYHAQFAQAECVDWSDERLKRITRIRLLSDPGFPWWDVSYCHGELKDGTKVRVMFPFGQLPKKTWKSDIIKAAKRDGVYAKGIGVFDAISTLC